MKRNEKREEKKSYPAISLLNPQGLQGSTTGRFIVSKQRKVPGKGTVAIYLKKKMKYKQ